jgi:single-strand selective monofunctional uracil DNA glycosylase
MSQADTLVKAAIQLRNAVEKLSFSEPTAYIYNPLRYAWAPHKTYVERYGNSRKRVLFMGMNPGPFGMAQTGIPFGEVASVREWLGIETSVKKPKPEHPKRPIDGFACTRSEVSGRRLWGAFAERFGTAEAFFEDHFVINFCPLVFMEEGGKNRTPDKLPKDERSSLDAICQKHLRRCVKCLEPEFIVGVGRFAEDQANASCSDLGATITRVLHPSPASPLANKGWARQMNAEMQAAGIW